MRLDNSYDNDEFLCRVYNKITAVNSYAQSSISPHFLNNFQPQYSRLPMMSCFCCLAIAPYRPSPLDHESKFDQFMSWSRAAVTHRASESSEASAAHAPYAVQLVQQVNYGPQESIRYFIPVIAGSEFVEVTEEDLIQANYEKLNS